MTLEPSTPLSRSPIWDVQKAYFEKAGIRAWSSGAVPHYITSNPFIARSYARIVMAWLRDLLNAQRRRTARSPLTLDATQPVYILELGSGPGRFAFHFLRHMLSALRNSHCRDIAIKYVMTDMAANTIDFWRAHPGFAPFIEAGCLDFARFDPEEDDHIELLLSGEVLAPGRVDNPIAAVANYFFDGVPQDAFAIIGGELHESRVTVLSSRPPSPESDGVDPDIIGQLTLHFEHVLLTEDYYDNPSWNRILREYAARLDHTALLFPVAAMRCMDYLTRLANGRLLMISADKGWAREEELLGQREPSLTVHGSFSLMVNYHAIAQLVRLEGGQSLCTPHRHAHLAIVAFLRDDANTDYAETRRAFDEEISQGGPDDFYSLKSGLENLSSTLGLPELLAYIRLSGFDATILMQCSGGLGERLKDASEDMKQAAFWVLQQVWANYIPIDEEQDLAGCVGQLLLDMAYYPQALEYLQVSYAAKGSTARTNSQLALAHWRLNNPQMASQHLEKALALDPSWDPARALRLELEAHVRKASALEPPVLQGNAALHALERERSA